MRNCERSEQTGMTTRAHLFRGLVAVVKVPIHPRSAFHDYPEDEIQRPMAVPSLVLVFLALWLFLITYIPHIITQLVNSGQIQLPAWLPLDLYIRLSMQTGTFILIPAVLISWLGLAGVSFFICRLMGTWIRFPPLLTLSAFVLLPTFWLYTPLIAIIWINPDFGWLLFDSLHLPILLVMYTWSAAIQFGAIRSLSDLNSRRTVLVVAISQLLIFGIGLLNPTPIAPLQ